MISPAKMHRHSWHNGARRSLPSWAEFLRAEPIRREATFAELAPAFLAQMAKSGGRDGGPAKPSTLRSLRSTLNTVLLPAFAERRARDIDARIIEAWLASMKAARAGDGTLRPYAERTRGRFFWTLSDFLQFAVDVGAADKNAARDVRREARPSKRLCDPNRSRHGVLSLGQIRALIYSKSIAFGDRLLFALLLLTGMRVSEAVALEWRDWDPLASPLGMLTIARQWDCKAENEDGTTGRLIATKTEEIRYAPVMPTLVEFFIEARDRFIEREGRLPSPFDLMISKRLPDGSRDYINPPTVLRHFRASMVELGFPHPSSGPRRTHDNRRTFINRARRAGAPRDAIRAITHADESQRLSDAHSAYVHLEWIDLCEVGFALERALGGVEP